jgi:hypothetical protein
MDGLGRADDDDDEEGIAVLNPLPQKGCEETKTRRRNEKRQVESGPMASPGRCAGAGLLVFLAPGLRHWIGTTSPMRR